MERPKLEAKRILIVLQGSIGDVTRALPLASLIRRAFPTAFLAWSVEPLSAPLLEGNPAIDEVILFDRRRWWISLGKFLAGVRARKFDLVLDLQRHLKSGVISLWSGAPRRLGFHRGDSKEFNWLFNNLHIPQYGEQISKLDHYLKFAEFLGIEPSPLTWNFELTDVERVSVEGHLKNLSGSFAVLFVGTRWQSKNWFPAQIARCAELLRADYQLDVVLLGGAADRQLAEESAANARVSVLNLVGGTSLRDAIGIIERAMAAVGPDTGLMHIAAAVGTPVVSLWGATNPERTGPYRFGELVIQGQASCSPCYQRNCPIGRICMQSITTEQIAAKLGRVLPGRHSERVRHVECG